MGNYKRNYPDLKSCLQDIVRNEGIGCLTNGGKLVSMLIDLIPQNRGDINMVKRMAENGILKNFYQSHTMDENSRNRAAYSAVEKLVNWESIDRSKAEGYVRTFAEVLQWYAEFSDTVNVATEARAGEKEFPQEQAAEQQSALDPTGRGGCWEENVLQETSPQYFHRLAPKQAILGEPGLPDRRNIATVTCMDTLSNAPTERYDVSHGKTGHVWAWAVRNLCVSPKEQSGAELYDLYIAAEGGINGGLACKKLFYCCIELRAIHFNGCFHTDQATTMRMMFSGCKNLESLDLSGFNTEKVLSMETMFGGCVSLTDLNVSSFQTWNVTSMNNMFANCSALERVDLTGFDMGDAVDQQRMFAGCKETLRLR